jgi:hypothetical protein
MHPMPVLLLLRTGIYLQREERRDSSMSLSSRTTDSKHIKKVKKSQKDVDIPA